MSEKHPHSHESDTQHHEALSSHDHIERVREKIEKEATEAQKNDSQERLEAAQKKVETLAAPTEKLKQTSETPAAAHEAHKRPFKAEQKISFSRTMTRVRKRLNVAEKPFSKVIHNPTVDKVSEVAGRTVARPSSMLGGAFFSLIGTSALLWITNHYGYEYNYLVVILLFAVGMVAGLLIEVLYRTKNKIK